MTEILTAVPVQRTGAETYESRPIDKLNGLSIRRLANIIHNSLMLVENPESLNYNTAARLYKLFTNNLDVEQKLALKEVLRGYCNEDAEFKKRLLEVYRFQLNRRSELSSSGDYRINSTDDIAADIFANIQYRAGISTASGKSEDPKLEGLAGKYIKREPELRKKGITIDSVQLNSLTASYAVGGRSKYANRNIYRNYVEDFMNKCHASNNSSMKMTIREKDGSTMIAPIRGDSLEERFNRDNEKGFVGEQTSAPEAFALPEVKAIENRLEVMFRDEDTKTQPPLDKDERRAT